MKPLTFAITSCMLMYASGAFAGDSYGLLFTTPAQREQLDSRFSNHAADADPGDTATPAQQSPVLTLNGTLISNTGRKEVWINGQRQPTGAPGRAVRATVIGPEKVQIRPMASAPARTMKPGQIMDTATGRIREAYSREPGQPGG